MAQKPIDLVTVEKVVADWRTGEYSQRELAKKYHISLGKVSQITKSVEKDGERIVNAGFIYKQALATHDERMMNAVNEVVDFKLRVAGLANTFAEKSIIKSTAMLDIVDDALSIKHLSDAVDKNTITVGVSERHGKGTQINNTTQTAHLSINAEQARRMAKEFLIGDEQ